MAIQLNYPEIFPVNCISGMIFSGLCASQIRIRRITYRFLIVSGALRQANFYVRCGFLEYLKSAGESFELAENASVDNVAQVRNCGTFIEDAKIHPASLQPTIGIHDVEVEWICHHPTGKRFALGQEDEFGERKIVRYCFLDEPVSL